MYKGCVTRFGLWICSWHLPLSLGRRLTPAFARLRAPHKIKERNSTSGWKTRPMCFYVSRPARPGTAGDGKGQGEKLRGQCARNVAQAAGLGGANDPRPQRRRCVSVVPGVRRRIGTQGSSPVASGATRPPARRFALPALLVRGQPNHFVSRVSERI